MGDWNCGAKEAINFAMLSFIMEYGSTPYVGMAQKKMAALLNVYKI